MPAPPVVARRPRPYALLPTPAGAPSRAVTTASAPGAVTFMLVPLVLLPPVLRPLALLPLLVAAGGAAATMPSASAPELARTIRARLARHRPSSVIGRTHSCPAQAGSLIFFRAPRR